MKPSNLINKLGKDNSGDNNKILENIRKNGGNKSCFDCGEKGVTYVVPKFGVFVCSRCSGIHREIGNMVKGLGVSNFSEKEISLLQEMGNDNAQEIWMAKFNPSKHKLPKPNDESSIKEHLKLKYSEKKWYQSKTSEEIKESKGVRASKELDDEPDESIKPDTLKKKANTNTTPNINNINKTGKEKKASQDYSQNIPQVKAEPAQKQLKKLDFSSKGITSNQTFPAEPSWTNNQNQNAKQQVVDDPFDFSDISSNVPAVSKEVKTTPVQVQTNILGNDFFNFTDFSGQPQPKIEEKSENPFEFPSSSENKNSQSELIKANSPPNNNQNQGKKNIDDVFKMLNEVNQAPQTQQHHQIPQQQFFQQNQGDFGQQSNNPMMNPNLLMQNPQLMMMFQQMLQSQGLLPGSAPGYPQQTPYTGGMPGYQPQPNQMQSSYPYQQQAHQNPQSFISSDQPEHSFVQNPGNTTQPQIEKKVSNPLNLRTIYSRIF